MYQLSRFSATMTLIAASLFLSRCSSEEGDPKVNTPKELKGTATRYEIAVAPTGRIYAVYMEFKDQDDMPHKVSLHPAFAGDVRDQASQTLSTDNFLSEQSIVQPNKYNQLVLMKDNKDFNVFIDVDEEDQEDAGVRSISVAIPSRMTLALEYVNENDVLTLSDPENRDMLSEEISRVIDVIHNDRYKVILDN